MLSLLTTLQHDSAVVVGHDIGGAVAAHMAALAPERVHALVLIGTPLHNDAWPPAAVMPLLVPGLGHAIVRIARRREELRSRLVSAVAGGAVTAPDGLRGLCELATAYDADAATAALDIVAASPPPTLVLWGEDDRRLAPAYGARVAAAIPGATWVPVPDTGHLLPLERPERVAEEIAGFLADVPARAAG